MSIFSSPTTQTMLDMAILQIAAESYLDQWSGFWGTNPDLFQILNAGSNNLDFISPDRSTWSGPTGLTFTQYEYFMQNYEIVTHYKNDGSGFSATAFKDKRNNQVYISFRSTEFKLEGQGGNWSGDGAPGADGDIGKYGFALAQLSSMEKFYQNLTVGKVFNNATNEWNYSPTTAALMSAQNGIGVTGFSLGSHLATAFTVLHPEARTYNFNAAGVGAINGAAPTQQNLWQLINFYNEMMAWDGTRNNLPSSPLFPDLLSLFDSLGAWSDPNHIPPTRPDGSTDTAPGGAAGLLRTMIVSASNRMPYDLKYDALVDFMGGSILSGEIGGGVTEGTSTIGIEQALEAYRRYMLSGANPAELIFTEGEVPEWASRITQLFGHGLFFDPQNVANSGYHANPYFINGVPIEDLPTSRGYGFLSMVPGSLGEQLRQYIGDFGETHSIIPVVDSLTVVNLLQKLDLSFSVQRFGVLLQSASNRIETVVGNAPLQYAFTGTLLLESIAPDKLYDSDALEILVNSIAKIFLKDSFIPIESDYKNPEGFQDRDFRDHMHAVIDQISKSPSYTSLQNSSVVSLTGMSASEVAASAKNDVGMLYALLNGLPFAIVGGNSSAHYAQHDIGGSLQASNYSDEYLLNKALVLYWKLQYKNGADDADDGLWKEALRLSASVGGPLDLQAALIASNLGDKQFNEDWDTYDVTGDWDFSASGADNSDRNGDGRPDDLQFTIDGVNERLFEENHRITFGSSGNNNIVGGANSDRLFGEDGDDFLDGKKGDDHLEGGKGFDVYLVGHGRDTIVDSDGSGRVEWSTTTGNFVLRGMTAVSDPAKNWVSTGPNSYWDRQNNVHYLISNNIADGTQNLIVTSPGRTDGKGYVTIRNFHDGDFGISLAAATTPVSPVLTDQNDTYGYGDFIGQTLPEGFFVNYDGGVGNDLISGWDADDVLVGGVGDDFLIGGFGSDRMDGGDGRDLIGDETFRLGSGDTNLESWNWDPWPAGSVPWSSGNGWEIRSTGLGADNTFTLHTRYLGTYFLLGTEAPENNNDVAFGGGGDDMIFMAVGNDTVSGGSGNDYIEGGNDHDVLNGDEGDDIIFGEGGIDNVPYWVPGYSIAGNDQISGGLGNDALVGQGGNDTLDGGDGNDKIFGDNTANSDIFDGSITGTTLRQQVAGDDIIFAGSGDDEVAGGGGDDIISGGSGADRLWGDNAFIGHLDQYREYDGNDQIDGGSGNDEITGMGGHDILEGGEGDDIIVGDHQTAAVAYGDDFLSGGAGNDNLQGNAGNDYIDGGTGDDALFGDEGNDTLRGGAGTDFLNGGTGDDVYLIDANWGTDLIRGMNEGQDVVRFAAGVNPSSLNVSVGGFDGRLLIQDPATNSVLAIEGFFESSASGRRIEFANGTVWAVDDILRRFRGVNGSFNGTAAGETIAGDSASNTINGGLGGDTLLGGSGSDLIYGGAEDGYSYSDPDNDSLFGGEGSDTLFGEWGNDLLDGGSDNDTLYGGTGNDTLRGGAGDDILTAGHYSFIGGEAFYDIDNDTLEGGSGNDKMNGGLGRNVYSFAQGFGNDKIYLTKPGAFQESLGAVAETAVLSFAAGISAANLSFTRNGNDLVIAQGADRITIIDYAGRGGATVDFVFADGSTLSTAQLAFLGAWQGTNAPETVSGGSGNDVLNGYGGNDTINGNAGNDILIGGVGADRLIGGTGDDTYRYQLADGQDFIYGSVSGVDVLEFGAGVTASGITIYKSSLDSTLSSVMLYIVINSTGNYIQANWNNTTNDQVIDAIRFSDGSSLSAAQINATAQLMNLTLDFYSNDSAAVSLNGNQYANTLRAGSSFYGVMAGGAGDDTYILDYSGASIVESVNNGNDTVLAQVASAVLPDNIENLVLRPTWYVGATGIGNALDNIIDGSQVQGARLDGGAGVDVLIGSSYDDTYVIDNPDDVIVESSESRSVDTVEAAFSYSIAGSGIFENITLTGAANSSATGNELNNRLDGSQSAGSNVLTGGLGDDTYVIGAGDTAIEAVNQGNDTLVLNYASASAFNTSNYQNFERIELGTAAGASSITGGSGAEYLVGNQSSNIMDGGAGDDVLYASSPSASEPSFDNDQIFGGEGNDTIYGNGGSDKLFGGDGNDNITGGYTRITSSNYQPTNEITGGKGDDVLRNGLVYHYSRGDGADVIGDTRTPIYAGYIPSIKFGADIAVSDVRLAREGEALVITFVSSPQDRITIPQYWKADGSLAAPIGFLEFTNGAVFWDTTEIVGRAMAVTLTGTAGDDNLVTGAGFDTLIGGAGNDYLDAGTGNDTLDGGAGSDTYFFDSNYGNDRVINLNNAGTDIDIIQIAADFIPSNGGLRRTVNDNGDLILDLIYKQTTITLDGFMMETGPLHEIHFSDGTVWTRETIRADMLRATEFDDYIYALHTNDTVNALGGNDHVFGEGGNDILHGNDGNDFLSGGGGDDQLYGDAGDDSLDGEQGIDTLTGGLGNDTYYISDMQDTVIEGAGEGTDTVYASVENYTLTVNVENLALDGTIAGAGNALNNRIEGNELNNTIDGGAGTDTMLGGLGDDTYLVDVSTDVVTEGSAAGTDTVLSSASTYTLGSNVENLTLTGMAAINGTGNTLANTMIGNAGNNSLSGGSGNDRLEGAAGDDTLNGGTGNDTMLGGVGNDTYVVDAISDVVTENANEGVDTVQASVNYTLGNNVENLTLTGTAITATGNVLDNVLTGNASNNTLNGGDGNDTLNGGSGTDTLVGGLGNDIYIVDTTTDVITENAASGTDTVQASVSFSLAATAFNNVENLTLTGSSVINATGNALDNILTGNSANNTLTGGAGNDTLIGGAGTDTMVGGTGNDTYVVDATGDVVTEAASEGTDSVQSSVTYTLATNVENLTLTGIAAINATGNTLNNVLTGNSANNTLNGGTGNDTMIGGAGDDTYVVDATADVITELLNEGIDLVQSSVAYTLSNNVENLTLTGTATAGTGNALDNLLTGNASNNTLNGGDGNDTLNGGSGTDTLVGGLGNDIYVVDTTTDIITENAASGTDTVQSSVSFSLAAAAFNNVENLSLTGTATTATGNALDNVLIGNASNNTLTGNAGNDTLDGGAGIDTMVGGVGNDIYLVDVAGDVITELANEGTDTVQSAITYTLGTTLENLTLTGTTAINGTGNAANNVMTGNSGNNTLSGGAGNDTIYGGSGNDTLIGGSGNNQLFGGDGADILSSDAAATGGSAYEGGTGNDTITGGQQNDTYRFNIGDGQDTITDAGLAGFTDNISFGAGITSSMLSYARIGNNLLISVNGNADTITVNNWYSDTLNQIEQISFANGTSLNASQIQTLTTGLVARTASTAPAASVQSTGNALVPSTTTSEENLMTEIFSDHRFSNQGLLDQIQSFNDLMRPGHSGLGGLIDGAVLQPVGYEDVGRDEFMMPGVIEVPMPGRDTENVMLPSNGMLGQIPGQPTDSDRLAPGQIVSVGDRAADGSYITAPGMPGSVGSNRPADSTYIAPGFPGDTNSNRSADDSFIAPRLPSNDTSGDSLHGIEVGVGRRENHRNAMASHENRMQRRLERQAHMSHGAFDRRFDEQELEYLIQSMARFGSNASASDSIKPNDQDHVQPIVIVPPSI